MLVRYLTSLAGYLPFLASAYLLAPVLPAFAKNTYGSISNGNGEDVEPRLPKALGFYMTPDNSLFGDDQWAVKHPDGRYWNQVAWLLRNPAYGLAWGPLAYTPSEATTYKVTGDPSIKARESGKEGYYLIESSDGAFEYTTIRKIPGLPLCLKVRFGWILGDAAPGKPCLFLFSPRVMPFL